MSFLREPNDLRDHGHHDDVLANKEHELTLSTAAIFGIFFGQVVLCAIFFGFGYSLGGHRSTGTLPNEGSSSAATNPNFGGFKPAAGQPAGAGTRPAVAAVAPPAVVANDADDTTTAPAPATPTENKPAPTTAAPIVRTAPVAETPRPPAAAVGLFVQVAAISVSHPEDATLMQNSLRAKGYAVAQHPGPDQYIHLLLGPFGDRAAAEAMRQRLQTDGYTAYIK